MIVEVVFYRENAISPQVAPPGFTLRFPVQSRSLGKSRIVRSSFKFCFAKRVVEPTILTLTGHNSKRRKQKRLEMNASKLNHYNKTALVWRI